MADDKSKEAEVVELIIEGINGAEEFPAPANSSDLSVGDPHSPNSRTRLPAECPVEPLGKFGDIHFFLDVDGQLTAIKAKDFHRRNVLSLFGQENYLIQEFWPRLNKDGEPIGPDFNRAEMELMAAAASAGIWSPAEKIRGPGAWRGELGELIMHMGDVILIGSESRKPGRIGRFVYATGEQLPRPVAGHVAAGEQGPAAWLLEFLSSWNWRRPDIDARLLLGWIGAAMIGGALDWRSSVWITGGRGTGKTTLQHVLADLFGSGLVSVSDASAAGLWQKLGYATLPVALDEIEASDDNKKSERVIQLARQAASGGVVLRGGADHKSSEFIARSCFLFSSILVPPLEAADVSRIAILELDPLPGRPLLSLDPTKMAEVGAQLRRRIIQSWPRLKETLSIFTAALTEVGHDRRGCDQYGVLLACGDLLLHDGELAGESAREQAAHLEAGTLAEFSDTVADEVGMIEMLLTTSHDASKGGKRFSVGEWISRAAGYEHSGDPEGANQVLGGIGLRVIQEDGQGWLAIANANAELAKLFQGSKWSGKGGRGAWRQSARRLEGARPGQGTVRIGGSSGRATLVPLATILGETIVKPTAPAALDGPDDLI